MYVCMYILIHKEGGGVGAQVRAHLGVDALCPMPYALCLMPYALCLNT